MYLQLQEIEKERKQLQELNTKLKFRADKFNGDYKELTLEDFRLLKLRKAQQTGDQKVTDLEERQKLIRQRTRKFYNLIEVEDAQKFFEEKIVPDFSKQDIVLRTNAIHLYGVDYMSSKMIYTYFGEAKIKIEWLNDSSCNIAFQNQQILTEQVSRLLLKTEQIGGVMTDQSEQMWRELIPYVVDDVQRRLFCRQATNKDIKSQAISGKNSKYYQYSLTKLQLKKFVRNVARNKINKVQKQELHKPHGRKKIQKVKRQRKQKKQQQQSDQSSSGVDSDNENMIEQPAGVEAKAEIQPKSQVTKQQASNVNKVEQQQ